VAGGGANIVGGMVDVVFFSFFLGVFGVMRSAIGTTVIFFSSHFLDGTGGAWDEYL
jgi:hypothetical protein